MPCLLQIAAAIARSPAVSVRLTPLTTLRKMPYQKKMQNQQTRYKFNKQIVKTLAIKT